VLLLSGVYLGLFYDPSMREVVCQGSYVNLRGIEMSRAYESTLEISFDVRGGLLARQIHHWSALLFLLLGMFEGFFGSEFPGTEIIPRLYTLHIVILPGIMLALIGVHLALVWDQKHTHAGVRREGGGVPGRGGRGLRGDVGSGPDQSRVEPRAIQPRPGLGAVDARLAHDVRRRPAAALPVDRARDDQGHRPPCSIGPATSPCAPASARWR
jgi:hypothetical protein